MTDRRRVEELFEAALDRPESERERFVAEASESDDLRRAVLDLLQSHARAGILDRELDRSPAEGLDDPGAGGGATSTGAAGPGSAREPAPDDRVGPYRVLSELGRGGMAVVYLAERDDGQFRRRVALKVIRSDGDPDLPARMVAERQILASLDHPGIAKLLDGGVAEGGRPYLVMEHVPGLPIDSYCDRMRLSVRERLQLFLTVVRAVEHAHNNLVVHRDLKPSNILVTPEGRVKLLDFGIAKLLNPSLAGVDAPVTRTDRRIMTPEYASPEQLRGETLTTAADVYSLGVVLYRLLTGHAPYRLPGRDVAAVLTAILDHDPERPSSRASRPLERGDPGGPTREVEPSELAAERSSTPERLRRTLRGDLDAIVMKALRKEPARRYASAALLARDIEAWLTGEPVQAHRGSRWYRAQKLVRRHKVETAAVALVAASLLVGAGTAAWQAGIAGRERDRATVALTQAEQALAQSSEVTEFLLDLFRSGDPRMAGGEVTARDLLRRGVDRADDLADQPLVQARLLEVIGQMHYRLGQYDAAETLLRRALAVREAELGPNHVDVATALIHLARVHRSRAESAEAARLVERALRIRQASLPPGDPAIGEAIYELGWLEGGTRQEQLYRQALGIYADADTEVPRQVGLMHSLSTNLRRQGRLEEAVAMDRDALALAEARLGGDHTATAYAMVHLADQVRDLEQNPREAERLYRAGLEAQSRLEGPNSVALIHGLHSLAELLARLERYDEAETLVRRALSIQRTATGGNHPSVAAEMALLARHLALRGEAEEAVRLSQESIDLRGRLLGRSHPAYINGIASLAEVYARLGQYGDAVDQLEASLELRRAAGEDESGFGEAYRDLGRYLQGAGRLDEAETVLLRSLTLLESGLGTEHPNARASRRALFDLYTAWGRPDDAARYRVADDQYVAY